MLAIMKKEFLQIRRDPPSLVMVFVMPVMMLLFFGYAVNMDVDHIPLAVLDQDQSQASRQLVENMVQTQYFDLSYRVLDGNEIRALLDGGRVRAALVIPPGYARALRRGETATAQLIVDGSDPLVARTALSMAELTSHYKSQEIRMAIINPQGVPLQSLPGIDLRARAWYNPDLKSQVFIVPGVLAVILQFTTTFMSVAVIVREREMGTLEQLVVTPIQPIELMLGKVLPLIVVGYVNITFILLLAYVWFGVAVKGSLLLLYAMTLAFFFSSLGIGTLISTVSRNFQQALQLSQLTLLPSILISGFLFPRESLPVALQWAGQVLPLTYYIIVVRGILIKGVGLEHLWAQTVPLVVLALVVFGLAITRFQKKID
ncbi:MAG: ABC transporter permease [Dehalococcoidia bacterium]|nr:ABC transporter permease [Dehalococcoidia bacterium]